MPVPPGSRQLPLFVPSTSPLLCLDPNHRLVKLTESLDWVELEATAQAIRRRKLKSRAGKPPQLRVMVGAVALMAVRKLGYREAEDQIRHYGPARYLCGLSDSTWSPDHTTIHDFTQLMGSDGMLALNEAVLEQAQVAGLLDLRVVAADTTAQEAPMGYPTEVGLMSKFLDMVSRAAKRGGRALQRFACQVQEAAQKGQRLLRKHRFFSKSKEDRLRTAGKLLGVVKGVKAKLGRALRDSHKGTSRLKRYSKVARRKLELLYRSADRLLPQIRYWLDTGWVAKNKLVNLLMPEVSSIPRGKVGKDVEFGLKWGIARYGGGFVHGVAGPQRGNFSDKKHVIEAVEDARRLFGQVPEMLTYDRGGYSEANIEKLRALGVRQPGLAPVGAAPWAVTQQAQRKAKRERVKVEGAIGALKSGRYAFNRPLVRSAEMMLTCGQRSLLGYNLNRLLDGLANREGLMLAGA